MGITSTSILTPSTSSKSEQTIDLQGHRGCRGILPENTIIGFIKALEIGVTTLEMDVGISKDKQVVVSHEPYFSHEFSTSPSGEFITPETEMQHNIYELTYDQIKEYDVGLRAHSRFTSQKKIKAFKPLLRDLIREVESYVQINGLKKPFYNIEIKRDLELELRYHPPIEEYAQLVVDEIRAGGISDRACHQSFDLETLQIVKRMAPELKTSLIVENEISLIQNIKNLGFTTDVYSPTFQLVTQDLVDYCKEKNILIIPWTVNSRKDMLRMIQFKVDGIITDYPRQLKNILVKMEVEIK